MAKNILFVLLGYLVGSLVGGIVLGHLIKGRDPRAGDNPGASGAFRQFGALVGVLVALFDILKAPAVLKLAQTLGATRIGLAIVAVALVAGHNWPVWFKFSGGGGLATVLGAMLYLAPVETVAALITALTTALTYWLFTRHRKVSIYPLPVGAMVGLPYLTWLLSSKTDPSLALAAGLSTLLIGLRGLQMRKRSEVREQRKTRR